MLRDTPSNAFAGRTTPPGDTEIEQSLGGAKTVWDRLLADLESEHRMSGREWKTYSPKSGWSLRLKQGKRTILWLSPSVGCFRVTIILSDQALLAARQARLPAQALKAIEEAERYPEGTSVWLVVKSARELAAVRKLAEIKQNS